MTSVSQDVLTLSLSDPGGSHSLLMRFNMRVVSLLYNLLCGNLIEIRSSVLAYTTDKKSSLFRCHCSAGIAVGRPPAAVAAS